MAFTITNFFKVAFIVLIGCAGLTLMILILALLIIESIKAIRKATRDGKR